MTDTSRDETPVDMNHRVPTYLRDDFNKAVGHFKRGQVFRKLIAKYVQNPAIIDDADLEVETESGFSERPLSDMRGFIDFITMHSGVLLNAISASRSLYIYCTDPLTVLFVPALADALKERLSTPQLDTAILFNEVFFNGDVHHSRPPHQVAAAELLSHLDSIPLEERGTLLIGSMAEYNRLPNLLVVSDEYVMVSIDTGFLLGALPNAVGSWIRMSEMGKNASEAFDQAMTVGLLRKVLYASPGVSRLGECWEKGILKATR